MPPSEKRLFLLRHATAQNANDAGDIGRPLSSGGKDDALALGQMMREKNYTPDFIFCSPARRTRETLDGIQKSLPECPVTTPQILYDGTTSDYLNELQHANDRFNTILFIAHNPSIYQLATLLTGEIEDRLEHKLRGGYAPATLSVLNVSCENWADIQTGENKLTDLTTPIEYNAPARPTRWM